MSAKRTRRQPSLPKAAPISQPQSATLAPADGLKVRPQEEAATGQVRRLGKAESASLYPTALGYVKTRYGDAIEYIGSSQGLRGLIMFWGLLCSSILAWPAWLGLASTTWEFSSVLDVPLWIAPFLVVGFCIYLPLWATRLELFRPEDEPTIFDRRHRKVYRIFRETYPGWRGLLKRWPLRATVFDWDLIDVEHQAVLTTTGSTVTRYHSLVFNVRKSSTDSTVTDSFTIGNSLELGEQTVPAVWEHIRRFMEEGGPHLPPGETLAPSQPPQSLWQSLQAVGPIGSSYRRWWSDNVGFMVLIHLLFPIFIPFFLLWGVLNWLSYKTATRIEWPDEVKRAVGTAG